MIRAKSAGKDYNPALDKFEWVEHSDGCMVCQKLGRSNSRGRKPKVAPAGRPTDHLLDLIATIKERAPPSLLLDFSLRERVSHHPSVDKDLTCPLCHLLLDRPVNLATCNKLVCLACCIGHLYKHTDLSCPCCGSAHKLDGSTVIPASPLIQKLVQDTKVPCEQCQQPVLAGIIVHNIKIDNESMITS
jgi:hypothetical protein